MTNKTMWLVGGSTGEYSDNRDWYVGVFASEDAAKAFVLRLEDAVRVCGVGPGCGLVRWAERARLAPLLAIDPDAQVDYTGVRYWAVPVAVIE